MHGASLGDFGVPMARSSPVVSPRVRQVSRRRRSAKPRRRPINPNRRPINPNRRLVNPGRRLVMAAGVCKHISRYSGADSRDVWSAKGEWGIFVGGTIPFCVELLNFACKRRDVDRPSPLTSPPFVSFFHCSASSPSDIPPRWREKKNNKKCR